MRKTHPFIALALATSVVYATASTQPVTATVSVAPMKTATCAPPVKATTTIAPPDTFAADVAALASTPHRLAGTAASSNAAAYIERRLRAIGVDHVIVQKFPAAQAMTKRCALTDTDVNQTFTIVPMRPNGIIPPVTPTGGISGKIVWFGDGTDADFSTKDPRGTIAVLNYNCEEAWLRAFRLGAKAVLFVKSGPLESPHQHYVKAPANLPRYYFNGNREALVEGHTATIMCEVAWEPVVCRNVIGVIRGTDRIYPLDKKPEAVVLSAQIDSFGEVPELSPGARGAANCAALLRITEYLKKRRLDRDVLIAFFDNEARSLAGSSAFYGLFEDTDDYATLPKRLASWAEESSFLSQMVIVAAAGTTTVSRAGDAGREFVNRLKSCAEDHSYEVRSLLMDARNAQSPLTTNSYMLNDQIAGDLALKDRWNDLRRGLGKGFVPTNTLDLYAIVHAETIRQIVARRTELLTIKDMLDASSNLFALIGNKRIALHASLMLGDTTRRWGVLTGGDADIHSIEDKPGLYGQVQNCLLAAATAANATGTYLGNFETASVDSSIEKTRMLWAAPFMVHSGEIAGRFSIYNIVFGTMHEALKREGTPDDTIDALNTGIIEKNALQIALLLGGPSGTNTSEPLLNADTLSIRSALSTEKGYISPTFHNGRPAGAMVMARQRGSSMPNKNIAGAVVMIWYQDPLVKTFLTARKAYGYDQISIVMTDQNGGYGVGPIMNSHEDPARGFAAVFDGRGSLTLASDQQSLTTVRTRLNMFACRGACAVLPPLLWPTDVNVYDARSNAQLFSPTSQRSCVQTTDGIVYWYVENRVNSVKLFTLNSIVTLGNDTNLANSESTAYGAGLPIDAEWPVFKPGERSAADTWRINEWRLSILRARDIVNSSLEEIHGRTQDLIDQAARTTAASVREALVAAAFLVEGPVYTAIRTSMDDLVKAVLILLGLSVPFAFALERLLIGSTKIQKQVAWFVTFFTLTFLCLYFSSPAFAIAKTPIIIFLGFAVVTLSVLVIVIIMQKFQVEIKALQGLTSTVHTADISRFNTIMAAMAMGISTMRRRPLRTALTAITILLLTFTILCFASFDTRIGIIKMFVGPLPVYTGVQVTRPTREPFNNEFLDTIAGQWSARALICPRYWLCPRQLADTGHVVARADGCGLVTVKAVLGITPDELVRRADLASVFALPRNGQLDNYVFITKAVAGLLGVKKGDRVLVKGVLLTVGPLMNAAQLAVLRDIDGSSILPVDFIQAKSTQSGQTQTTGVEDQSAWANLPADAVLVTSARTAKRMGAAIHSICLYTDDSHRATEIAEQLARLIEKNPIIGTRSDGVYRHVQGTVLAASGIVDLFFPLLLGGLIVFGTMLSSVADREKEIYTFSALGLAPAHVAGLFFAEAMVYSVIGGLGGYLLAQASMKILSFLATITPLRVPEMNYSSTNAMFAILVVMATVLVSATYPAIKASRSANPGLLRAWRLTKPTGNVFDLLFPFTVSEYDLTGVVSFLKEHFDNFSDTGLGCFMARDALITVDACMHLGLSAKLALSPFDLGVTQSFQLQSSPSEIAGIDEVRIILTRLSGQPKDWARLNKVLINDLRRQFLLWRSIPHETIELYRQRTLAFLAGRTSQPPCDGEEG